MHVALLGHARLVEHATAVQKPRTTPASSGWQTCEKRLLQSVSVMQVGWQLPSRHVVPVVQPPSSSQVARHSCSTALFELRTLRQLSPARQAQPSVHGSPTPRRSGPASPGGVQFVTGLQLDSTATTDSAQKIRMPPSYQTAFPVPPHVAKNVFSSAPVSFTIPTSESGSPTT